MRPQWRAMAALAGVLALTQLGYYLTSAALPLYLHDLGARENRIGLEVGLGSLIGLLVTLGLGPALNRLGSQIFLRLGALLYLVTAVGMLALPHEVAVTGLRALQGVGAAVILPSALALGPRLMPARQATSLGAMGALNNVGGALGPPVGLSLYMQYGAGGLFLPAGVAAGVAFLATSLVPSPEAQVEPSPGFGFDRRWTPLLLGNCLATVYFGGMLAYLPLDLQGVHGPNAGLFFTADVVGVLLLRLPTGLITDRRGSQLPKVLGLALTLPGIAFLALPPSILTLVLAGAGTGMGAGLFVTGIMADFAGLSSESNRGTAMSLGSASLLGGIFIGSAVSGLLIGRGGFDAVLLFGAITCVAAAPLSLRSGYRPAEQVAV